MAVQLIAFIFVASHYLFQGVANGGAYAKSNVIQYIGIAMQMLLIGFILHYVPLSFVNIALAFLTTSSLILTKIAFDGNTSFGDVHLFTYLCSFFFCFLVCYDLSIFGLIGVYAGLLLEKGLINIGSKLPFFDDRTDDESGDTFGVPSLGINIPRLKTAYRIPLAVLSLVCIGVTIFLKLNFTLHQLIEKYI